MARGATSASAGTRPPSAARRRSSAARGRRRRREGAAGARRSRDVQARRPERARGYKPPEGPEAAYEPFEGPGENARKRERGAGAAEDGRGASNFAAATEALPWTVGVSAEEGLRARSDVAAWAGPIVGDFGDASAEDALAFSVPPFRVDRAKVGLLPSAERGAGLPRGARRDAPLVSSSSTSATSSTAAVTLSRVAAGTRSEPGREVTAGSDSPGSDSSSDGKNSFVAAEGYLAVALGPSYVDEAARLVETLRKRGADTRPVALVCRVPEDSEYAEKTHAGVFERYTAYDPRRRRGKRRSLRRRVGRARRDESRAAQRPPAPARVRARRRPRAPVAAYVVLDTDVLCSASTAPVWSAAFVGERARGRARVKARLRVALRRRVRHLAKSAALCSNRRISPHVHAGAVFVDRANAPTGALERFAAKAKEAFAAYDAMGFLRLFREESRVLEACASVAFRDQRLTPLDFYEHAVMNFNVPGGEPLPSATQRIGGHPERESEGGKPYPLTHYFVKAGFREDYEKQYETLVKTKIG